MYRKKRITKTLYEYEVLQPGIGLLEMSSLSATARVLEDESPGMLRLIGLFCGLRSTVLLTVDTVECRCMVRDPGG